MVFLSRFVSVKIQSW